MAIRARPAGPHKKHGAGQDSEPTGPRGLDPHRPAGRAGRPASPHKIKKKEKKLALVYINYFFYGLLH